MGAPSNRPTADQGDAGVQPWPIKIDQTTPGTTNAVAPIAGQNGLDGGSGATTAKTVRTRSASDDDVVVNLGAQADSAASSDAGTFSLIALFKRLLGKFTTQFPAALAAGGGLKVEGVAGGVAQPVSSVDLGLQADTSATTDTGTFSLIALFKRLLSKLTTGITVFVSDSSYIINGKAFTTTPAAVVNVAIGASYDVLFVTPASPAVYLRDILWNINHAVLPSSGYEYAKLYEDTTTSADGTAVTPSNNNRNSAAAVATVFTGPTVTGVGTRLHTHLLHYGNETYVAPSRTTPFNFVLKASTKHLIRYTNSTNKAADVHWGLHHVEP